MDVLATYGLYDCLDDAFKEIRNYFNENYQVNFEHSAFIKYISPAYVTSLIYQQIFDKKLYKRLVINDFELIDSFLAAYYGGYVNYGCLGEYKSKTIKCYDVTAMYPFVMLGNYPAIVAMEDFSLGGNIDLTIYQDLIDETIRKRNCAMKDKTLFDYKWLTEFTKIKGIFYCTIISPSDENDKICISPIPYRMYGVNKLIYDYKTKTNATYCTAEMKTMILYGFKIKLHYHKHNIVFHRQEKNIQKHIGAFKRF